MKGTPLARMAIERKSKSKSQWLGDVAQWVELLSSIHIILGSIPRTALNSVSEEQWRPDTARWERESEKSNRRMYKPCSLQKSTKDMK